MLNKWDLRFLKLAREVSKWSKDPRRKVGAVVAKNRRILSTGYNGYPSGFPDDVDRGDKNTLTVHAEANAIAGAKTSLKGATIYVAGLHPCSQCASLIVQAGIKRVVYDFEPGRTSSWLESVNVAKEIFTKCKVQTECSMPKIIMVGGKKRSGKSWVAEQLGMPVRAFADVPKLMFKTIFGVDFDNHKADARALYGGLTARGFMQHFATDACQRAFGAEVWRDLLIETLQQDKARGVAAVAISDWRFKHEVIPGALKVYVLGGVTTDQHQSENDIGPEDADCVLDNSERQLSKDSISGLAAI